MVIFRAQQEGKVANSAKEILTYLQPHLKGHTGFTCSGFLNKSDFEAGEKVVVRFTSLGTQVQGIINMILFRNKVTETPLLIDNKLFTVVNIDLHYSQYAYSFDETIEIDNYPNTYQVKLLSPASFKVGDTFKAELIEKLLIKNMASMYRRHTSNIIDKTKLSIAVTEQHKVRRGNKEMVIGEFIVTSEDTEVYKLMQFIQYMGIGYQTAEGYGAVLVSLETSNKESKRY